MAQGDGLIYNEFKKELLAGNIDLDGHTIVAILVAAYTPDIDADTGYASVSAKECSGTNYTAATKALGTKAVSKDTTNDLGKFTAANVTWTALLLTSPSATPSHIILYDDSHASDCLIACWELTTATNGGDYTIQWNASGIITLT